jgi:hypothetical protein
MKQRKKKVLPKTSPVDLMIRRITHLLRKCGLVLQRRHVCHVRKCGYWQLMIQLPSKYWANRVHVAFEKRKELRQCLSKLGLAEGSDYRFLRYRRNFSDTVRRVRSWIYKVAIPTPTFSRLMVTE